MSKEFTKICRDILDLADWIKSNAVNFSILEATTAEIKENIAKASALNQSLKELRAHLENNDFSSLLAAYNEVSIP